RNIRRVFIKKNLSRQMKERQTVIVANEKDFLAITAILKHTATGERVLGRAAEDTDEDSVLETSRLPELVRMADVKEIIFCEEETGFSKIISIIQQLPSGIHNMFHASGSSSIISSDSKDEKGEV